MVEFKGTVQLEAWLTDQPGEVSVAIAARAVLRAVDILYDEFEEIYSKPKGAFDKIVLEFLRTSALTWSSIGGHHRTEAVAAAHNLSSSGIFGSVVNTGTADVVRAAEFAFSTAAAAAGSPVDEVEVADFAVSTVITIMAARKADAPSAARLIWRAISQDVTAIENGMGAVALAQSPLNLPQKVTRWREFADFLTRRDPNWRFWVDWYEARLAGHPPSRRFERALLSLTEKEWEADARTVNALLMERMHAGGRPAVSAFYFKNGKIEGEYNDLHPEAPEHLASELHGELRRQLTSLHRRLFDNFQGDPTCDDICADIKAALAALGNDFDQVNAGALLGLLAKFDIAAERIEALKASGQVNPPDDLKFLLTALSRVFEKFMGLYGPDLKLIEDRAAALSVRPEDYEENEQILSEVLDIAKSSNLVAGSAVDALSAGFEEKRRLTEQIGEIDDKLDEMRLELESLRSAEQAREIRNHENFFEISKEFILEQLKEAVKELAGEALTRGAKKLGKALLGPAGRLFQKYKTPILRGVRDFLDELINDDDDAPSSDDPDKA